MDRVGCLDLRRRRVAFLVVLGCLLIGPIIFGGGAASAMPAARGCCHSLLPTASRRLELDHRTQVAGCALARRVVGLPKMLYPTLDYGNRTGGTIWHRWIKPHGWSDGDDVVVRHAHWLSWNSQQAAARVRVVIAARRGRGRVTLSDPGYCPAAHAFGFLRETDRGGPWGRGGSFDLGELCEPSVAASRDGAALLRSRRLPSLNDGERFRVKPPTLSGWTFDGGQVFGGPSANPPHGYFPGGTFGRINWRSWTRHLATGEGVVWTDDCEPSCGDGEWQPSPTLVTAYRPRRGTFQRMRFVCDCADPDGTRARFRLKGDLPPQWELVRQWSWRVPLGRRNGRAAHRPDRRAAEHGEGAQVLEAEAGVERAFCFDVASR